MTRRGLASLLLLLAAAGTARAAAAQPPGADTPSIERGASIFAAGGCAECHTDKKNKGAPLAGGRALATAFGIFYSPNITPDPTDGIGRWSDADFIRALRRGIAPDGRHYYPVFPYPSFTLMTDRDMLDLKAFLFAQAPVARPSKPHALRFPFGIRVLMIGWDALFLEKGPFAPDAARPADWNRGAYLVRALGHCGECHTPRNALGAVEPSRFLSGSDRAPEGKGSVPNITPDKATGIGKWAAIDITYLLETGFQPDGDSVGGAMAEVVEASTSKLHPDDRAAIATYLMSLPPIDHKVATSTGKPAAQ
jgi:mono/diheme cytochrome c family protein